MAPVVENGIATWNNARTLQCYRACYAANANEEHISREITLLIKARYFCLPKDAHLYAAGFAIRSSLAQASRHFLPCLPATVQDEDHGGGAADGRDGQQRVEKLLRTHAACQEPASDERSDD